MRNVVSVSELPQIGFQVQVDFFFTYPAADAAVAVDDFVWEIFVEREAFESKGDSTAVAASMVHLGILDLDRGLRAGIDLGPIWFAHCCAIDPGYLHVIMGISLDRNSESLTECT